MYTTRAHSRGRKRGMALAVALVTLLILTVMGLAIGAMGIENLSQIKKTGKNASLLHAANGGLHEVMDRLYQNGDYGKGVTDASADGSGRFSTSSVAANYWWTFNTGTGEPYCTNNLDGDTPVNGWNNLRVPPHMALMVVSADPAARPGGNETVMVVALVTNKFPYAVASDGTIDVSDVSSVIPGQGNVRSNAVGGSPNIAADTVDGISFSRDGTGSIDISGNAGPERYDEPKVALPDVPIERIVLSYSTAGVAGAHPFGGPATFQIPGPGPHDIRERPDGSLEIQDPSAGSGWTRIHPRPASVHIEGNVRITGGGTLTIPRGIHFFVNGNFQTNGSLEQDTTPSGGSSSPLPADANFFFVTGDMAFNGAQGQDLNILCGGNIRQNGSSDFTGIVYSQDGTVDFNGSGSVTGTVIARAGVTNPGNTEAQNLDVRYDPDVLEGLDFLGLEVTGPVRTASWWSSAK